ncbi:hypothetical protein Hamer_G025253 [Homarus americanus]|uniref:Uncharacterized protein n=1 Tax=Homarus americanus TaxID=6706 RepID=A0A8J5K2N9_HOMAM|nr:hypothetical protein Hamer_G025253 [Homarus americanus]
MGSAIEVMFNDDLAHDLNEHLKKTQEDKWVMICGYKLQKRALYVGMGGNVRIFYVPSLSSPLPDINMITIWECRKNIDKRIMYGVIKEVVKHPTITIRGTYHTLLSIVDPTCLHPRASINDMLLHIFLNEPNLVKLRGTVERGQIIRTSNMMVEHYNNKYVAKVFSAKSVVRFSSACSEEFEPITDYENYRVTDVEKAEITRLREWWASHHHELLSWVQQRDRSQQVAQPPRVQDTVRVEDSARVKDTDRPIKRTYPSPRGSSTPAKRKC